MAPGVTLQHPVMGATPYDGPATIYARTPPTPRRPAPCLGEHTDMVLRDLLGADTREVEELRTLGAFGEVRHGAAANSG